MAQSYEKAGVNLEAGYEVVRRIKKHVASTSRLGVMGNIGAFGGMVSQKLVAVDKSALSCVLGGVFMAILLYVSGKFKISWLKEWNLTIAILVAMVITALV